MQIPLVVCQTDYRWQLLKNILKIFDCRKRRVLITPPNNVEVEHEHPAKAIPTLQSPSPSKSKPLFFPPEVNGYGAEENPGSLFERRKDRFNQASLSKAFVSEPNA